MRISDWSSDVCSSDLYEHQRQALRCASISLDADGSRRDGHLYRICRETCRPATGRRQFSADMVFAGKSHEQICLCGDRQRYHHPLAAICLSAFAGDRSEEHTSELQSLMRISYAVFCLKKKKNTHSNNRINN